MMCIHFFDGVFSLTVVAFAFVVVSSGVRGDDCPSQCYDIENSCNNTECVQNCEFNCVSQAPERCYHHPPIIPPACPNWCVQNLPSSCDWRKCRGCGEECNCYVSFKDVTNLKFPQSELYWHQWGHSGRPYQHEGAPIIMDLNGDGINDFFTTMHAHPLGEGGYDRMELGESVPFDFEVDNVKPGMEFADANITRLRRASYRVIIDDEDPMPLDPHGSNIMDLDGDGILDMLIASGGGRGGAINPKSVHQKSNFILWGEESKDEVTGETTTYFRGGRDAARNAGVDYPDRRGRVHYVFDANGDGRLDLFLLANRRVSNEVTPGVLLINQGDRTWKADDVMQEYTNSMILTDADGDGHAQEIVLSRAFCFPQRLGPDVDPSNADFGPFTTETREFCSSRPVGTTAVFKYDMTEHVMKEISKPFLNASPEKEKQPNCCPHGTWSTECSARSMVTGDFDGDLLADIVVLFRTKMAFHFSSDRETGELPAAFVRAAIEFPGSCEALSAQVVDLDNDGQSEIFVLCKKPGTFLIYSQGPDGKDDWTLNTGCNGEGTMGDLTDASLAGFTDKDYTDICDDPVWAHGGGKDICAFVQWQSGLSDVKTKKPKLQATGWSIADLNNDGFLDVVVSYHVGHMNFFHNVPSLKSKQNRFIAFKLVGAGNANGNRYGLGATLILATDRGKQFREINSHLHADRRGTKDERIIFGLGLKARPIALHVKWPNEASETFKLERWEFSSRVEPVVIQQS